VSKNVESYRQGTFVPSERFSEFHRLSAIAKSANCSSIITSQTTTAADLTGKSDPEVADRLRHQHQLPTSCPGAGNPLGTVARLRIGIGFSLGKRVSGCHPLIDVVTARVVDPLVRSDVGTVRN